MKWTEKGISFEGTVEEFKALHGMRPALLLPEPREEGLQESEPEKRILKKRERTGLVVEVTQRDGSSIVLPSMSAAFRWYVGERGSSEKSRVPPPSAAAWVTKKQSTRKGLFSHWWRKRPRS